MPAKKERPLKSSQDLLVESLKILESSALVREHPVQARVAQAMMRSVSRILESPREVVPRLFEEAPKLEELASWLPPADLETKNRNTQESIRYWLQSNLLSPSEMGNLVTSVRKPKRGRPITQRAVAVAYYEAKLASPKLSWQRLAPRFCYCTEEERAETDHAFKCWQRLRQEVMALKRTLRRHGLEPKML